MEIDRRQLLLPALAVAIVGVVPALAASSDEEQVSRAVEAFRLAQIAADGTTLDTLCAAELSYSHADARVEDKAAFIANSTSGKSKFLSLEYRDLQISVVGPAAIVRFHGISETEWTANGNKFNANLHILMNWQKQGNDWKLLSRASTDLSTPASPSITNGFWRFLRTFSTIQR